MPEKLQGVIKDISNIPVKKYRWFERLLERKPLIAMIFILLFSNGFFIAKWIENDAKHNKIEASYRGEISQANANRDSAYRFANERVERALDRQEKINDNLLNKVNSK